MDTYLDMAIRISGGVTALARIIEVKSQAVSQWKKTPSERVLAVAEAAAWKVTPHNLRPDLYPHPLDGIPESLRPEVQSQ